MATEQDRRIGEAVIALRADRTQQAVADDMRERGWRWGQATVWSVEKGERPLRLAEAGDLATLFGVRLECLLAATADERRLQQLAACEADLKRSRARFIEANVAMNDAEKAVDAAQTAVLAFGGLS